MHYNVPSLDTRYGERFTRSLSFLYQYHSPRVEATFHCFIRTVLWTLIPLRVSMLLGIVYLMAVMRWTVSVYWTLEPFTS